MMEPPSRPPAGATEAGMPVRWRSGSLVISLAGRGRAGCGFRQGPRRGRRGIRRRCWGRSGRGRAASRHAGRSGRVKRQEYAVSEDFQQVGRGGQGANHRRVRNTATPRGWNFVGMCPGMVFPVPGKTVEPQSLCRWRGSTCSWWVRRWTGTPSSRRCPGRRWWGSRPGSGSLIRSLSVLRPGDGPSGPRSAVCGLRSWPPPPACELPHSQDPPCTPTGHPGLKPE
jgi:hypothetical protein